MEDFIFDDNQHFSWKMPSNNPGNVIHYEFSLDYVNLNWEQTPWCKIGSNLTQNLQENVTALYYSVNKLIASAGYKASIAAVTSRGSGNITYLDITSDTSSKLY